MALFIALLGCSKKHTPPGSGLAGTWRQIEAVGGIAGQTIHYDQVLRLLRINEDSTWQLQTSGTMAGSGQYSLSTVTYDSVTFFKQITFRFSPPNDFSYIQIIRMANGQLLLQDLAVDGYTNIYTRYTN